VGHDLVKLRLDFHLRQAIFGSPPDVLQHLCGVNQGLGGYATIVGAIPTRTVLFDQSDVNTSFLGFGGDGKAAASGSDYNQIKL
jgi:hypothetical protein